MAAERIQADATAEIGTNAHKGRRTELSMYSGSVDAWPGGRGSACTEKVYVAAETLSYFAVDSRNKTGENEFAVKPSQDGEDKIFENRIKRA
jgi:hypothetical protein